MTKRKTKAKTRKGIDFMKRLAALAIGLLTLGVVLSGCSGSEEKGTGKAEESVVVDSSEESSEEKAESAEPEETKETEDGQAEAEKPIKVYVPNQDATALVEVPVEENADKNPEEIVIDKLKEQETGNQEYRKAIREDIVVHSVTVEGDMAIVDISSENLMGSGMEESFLIDSVVMSLTALDGIERVQFLVDGEKRDSLMGHIEIGYPLTAEDVGNNVDN